MEMDERKTKILQAIIRNYLETGEPVGSRTISKYTDLNLSSATIRNEMADLEEMGYIVQPHTSAGRIPSDKGYRFYVDTMMEAKEREVSELKEALLERQDRLEDMLRSVVKFLAKDTQYATMITAPTTHLNKLKFIQLSKVDSKHILAVVVIEGNVIRNRMIEVMEDEITDEILLKLNILLNTQLNGLAIEEINLSMVAKMKQQAGIHSGVIGEVVDAVIETLVEEKDLEVYTSGANNIFKYPELADNNNAVKLITAFEEKELIGNLINDNTSSENTGIQVYIGGENQNQNMQDCSVVTATYDLGDGMKGTIGIVGPRRMDYDKVVGTLKTIKTKLDDLYHKE